jgi:hypothetical protein
VRALAIICGPELGFIEQRQHRVDMQKVMSNKFIKNQPLRKGEASLRNEEFSILIKY